MKKTMKNRLRQTFALSVAAAALGAAPAFAQTKNFEGLSLGLNLESSQGSLSASDGSSSNAGSTGAGLQAQYTWALGGNFTLGAGVTASTGNRKAGTYANGIDAYTSNRYSFDLMPGLTLNDNLLAYLKVSSLAATGSANDGSGTTSLQGLGYGLGLRGMIDRNMFWQVGYDSIRFNDATFANGSVASFKDSVLSVGAGYRF